jgi:signal transduction histidine kinase/HPt (histidine-containing phosphotransfer) domain-containing protein
MSEDQVPENSYPENSYSENSYSDKHLLEEQLPEAQELEGQFPKIKVAESKILVIDPDPISLNLIAHVLTRQGYLVQKAISGRMGLNLIAANPPDLLILDLILDISVNKTVDEMNGYEICRHLKQAPPTQNFPIIFCGARSDTAARIKALAGGAVDYLTKPIKMEEFCLRVKHHLSLHMALKQQQMQLQAEVEKRQKVETELVWMRSQGNLLATMSHEIRTPTSVVISATELLLDTSLTPQQRELAKTIYTSSDILLSLINDVLDFSKIESGKMELEVKPISLQACLIKIVRLFMLQTEDKNLILEYAIAPDVPPQVLGDVVRLRQVLVNLVGNALKFTVMGRVLISVDLFADAFATDQDQLLFAIHDTGTGIPAAKLSKLFQPFQQLDASIARLYGGTGLGLHICDRLVAAMGGQIWVVSQGGVGGNPPPDWQVPTEEKFGDEFVNQGSSFYFTVQMPETSQILDSDDTESRMSQEAIRQILPSTLRILLVEDNLTNQKLMRAMLNSMGYGVAIASNGIEAMTLINQFEYDLVLMDIQMPKMNGLEATVNIRKLEKSRGRKALKIIAMTANALAGDREKCLNAGMDDYLSKPVRSKDLVEVLKHSSHNALVNQSSDQTDILKSDNLPEFESPESESPKLESPEFDFSIFESEKVETNRSLQSIIDETSINKILGISDSAFVVEMIDVFLQDAESYVGQILQAGGVDDMKSLRFAAHSLKSISASMGALQLSEMCKKFESLARSGAELCETEDLIMIHAEYRLVYDALQSYRQKYVKVL